MKQKNQKKTFSEMMLLEIKGVIDVCNKSKNKWTYGVVKKITKRNITTPSALEKAEKEEIAKIAERKKDRSKDLIIY
jgi:hypothetical protein